MRIFESHCHLNDNALYKDIDNVISRAKNGGIEKFLVIGWDKNSSLLAVKIAETYDCCYAAIGYHPENIYDVSQKEFDETMSLSSHPKVVAIGEIGLDYYWCKEQDKRNLQKEFFIKQIEYSNQHHLPIIIHNRDAFEDCLEILKEHCPKYSGIMHCYSGSVEYLSEVLKLNLLIGLGGPVTFKNAKTPKEVAYFVPLEKLALETDCPYLAPHPLRGTVNEPLNIRLVLDEIANIKGISKKHIAEVSYDNCIKLFGIKNEIL